MYCLHSGLEIYSDFSGRSACVVMQIFLAGAAQCSPLVLVMYFIGYEVRISHG